MGFLCCCGTHRRADSCLTDARPWTLPSMPPAHIEEPGTTKEPGFESIELDQLDIGDSDSERNLMPPSTQGFQAIEAVRNKIRKHLLHERRRKRPSAISVGHSQKELARRAELKRLMHKRIQEELRKDDSDVHAAQSSTIRPRKQTPTVASKGLTGGPRDNIEFAFPHNLSLSLRTDSNNRAKDWSTGLDDAEPSPSELSDTLHNPKDQPTADGSLSLCTSLPSPHTGGLLPSVSYLLAQHSSLVGSAPALNHRSDDICDSRFLDGRSALSIWLIAQDLQPRENGIGSQELTSAKYDDGQLKSSDHKKADGKAFLETQCADATSQHRSSTYRNAHSLPSKSETASKNPTVVHNTHTPEGSPVEPTHQVPKDDNASDFSLQHFDDFVAALYSDTPLESSSSKYPSLMPSFQPSPARSHADFNVLDRRDWADLGIPTTDSTLSRPEQKAVSTQTNEVAYKEPLRVSQISPETQSLAQSDAASFHQLEAELRTIEKRFGSSWSRQKVPLSSKFKEEFAISSFPLTGKSSVISRMRRTRTRSSSIDKMLRKLESDRLPAAPKQEAHSNLGMCPAKYPLSANVFRTPSRQESATDLWKRAIRLEAEQRTSKTIHNGRWLLGMGRKQGDSRQPSPILEATQRKPETSPKSSISAIGSHSRSGLTPDPEELSKLRPDERSKWLIKRWASQMGLGRPGFEADTSFRRQSQIGMATTPRSWARFPSHTRESRTANAGPPDGISPRDFAISAISAGGQIRWKTDRETVDTNQPQDIMTSVGRLNRAVRSGLTSLISPSTGQNERKETTSGGRYDGAHDVVGLHDDLPTGGDPPVVRQGREPNKRASLTLINRNGPLGPSWNSPIGSAPVRDCVGELLSGVTAESGSDDESAISNPEVPSMHQPQGSDLMVSISLTPKLQVAQIHNSSSETGNGESFATPMSGLSTQGSQALDESESQRRSNHSDGSLGSHGPRNTTYQSVKISRSTDVLSH